MFAFWHRLSHHSDMPIVKAHFAVDPYPREVMGGVRRGASGGEYTTTVGGSMTFSRPAAGVVKTSGGGKVVLDEKAKRDARDKRIDELMDVIEALHGKTLAELAK